MFTLLLALAIWLLVWRPIQRRLNASDARIRALEAQLERLQPSLAAAPITESPAPAPQAPQPVAGPVDVLASATPPRVPPVGEPAESLERAIGSRWLLYTGVAAIVLGISYFVKLAFENDWIDETARVIIGAAAGIAFIYAGTRFVRAGDILYGQALSGGGVAVLYVSIYAAQTFYALMPASVAFVLMCGVTGAAAVLADRQASLSLAVLAVGGGFATPFLVATGRDAQVALFTYAAILVGGTLYLARRRGWPQLNALSYVATVIVLAGWAVRHYTPDKYLLTELFLTLFLAMFLYLISAASGASDRRTIRVRRLLLTAPALYYAASLAVLYAHDVSFLIFLIGLFVFGIGAARQLQSSLVRILTWLAVEAPLAIWVMDHAGAEWMVVGLTVIAGTYALTLIAQVDALGRTPRLEDSDVGLLHLNALATYGLAYAMVDAVRPAATASLALGVAALHAALAMAFGGRVRDVALHFAGLALAFVAVAAHLQFDGGWAVAFWGADGAVAIWLGLRERRIALRAGGGALIYMAIAGLLVLQAMPPRPAERLFLGERALTGAFLVALLYGLADIYRRLPVHDLERRIVRAALLVAANGVTLLLLTRQIFIADQPRLTTQVMVSMLWGIYATGLIVAGLRRAYPPIRYLAIGVFAFTIGKVFLVDTAELERIYRVLSVFGVGVLLLMSSYLYQRAFRR